MSKKSSTTTKPWSKAQPYILGAAGELENTYNSTRGDIANISDTVQGLIPGLVDKFNQGNAGVNAAGGYVTDVLGGKYLSGNPYLENIIGSTKANVANDVLSQYSAAGRYGSGAMAGTLADKLSTAENQLRYGNYTDEMSRMAQAAGMAPNLASAEYAGFAPILQAAAAGAELPFAGINPYVSGMSNLLGGYTTQTQSPSTFGTYAGLLGTGIQALPGIISAFSDRRLKTNIRKIGEFADGLGKYAWNYVWGGPEHIGVMADEVEKLRPWALGPEVMGYKTVNYGVL